MIRYLLIISSFLIASVCFGQHYYAANIIKKADSILKSTVGQRIFEQYYRYDSLSYYGYKNIFGRPKWKALTDRKRTKGKFTDMSVRYDFCIRKYGCPCNSTSISFDSKLNLTRPLNLDFVPKYILNNDSCNFISDTVALSISLTNFKEKGVKPVKIGLQWDYLKQIYIWSASNILSEYKNWLGEPYGKVETIDIDALSGKIISHNKEVYAPVH